MSRSRCNRSVNDNGSVFLVAYLSFRLNAAQASSFTTNWYLPFIPFLYTGVKL